MPAVPRRLLLPLLVLACLIAPSAAQAAQQTLTFDLPNTIIPQSVALTGIPPKDLDKGGPTGLRMWVILPDGYTPTHCWPVLYLLHGSGTLNEWTDAGPLLGSTQAITVVPGAGDSQYTNWWNNGARSPRWESWFFDQVMTTVNSHFPICSQRNDHAIAGTSMGGFGALYLAGQRPDYFGSAGAFSGVPLDLGSPIIQLGFSLYPTVWGPANGFYAQGH